MVSASPDIPTVPSPRPAPGDGPLYATPILPDGGGVGASTTEGASSSTTSPPFAPPPARYARMAAEEASSPTPASPLPIPPLSPRESELLAAFLYHGCSLHALIN